MTNNCSPIAFFIPRLNGGGAQKVVVNLGNALVDLTDRPVHIVLSCAEGEFLDEVRREVEIVDLGKGRASRAIPALARYLRQVRPAVLCSSLNYANVCASLAWHMAGRPCRLVLREDNVVKAPKGPWGNRLYGMLLQRLMGWLYPRADAVVALGDGVAQTLQDRGICTASDIRVIGNPVVIPSGDLSVDLPSTERTWSGNYIVAVGRLAEQKGFDVLIKAFAQLTVQDVDLVILGEGPLRPSLEALRQDLGLNDRVHLPGFISGPSSVLAKSRLFVLSSRWEGLPIVLLEALAAAKPIVSTDCPGEVRGLLLDGALAHLVPTDDPVSLAEAITQALAVPRATPEERVRRANDFSAPAIARQYLVEAFELSADR